VANPEHCRSVYRYFDLADSFVQILLKEGETLALAQQPGFNRASYRRMVIGACMPEFGDEVEATLEALFPEDPLMVEDLLYQLCIEVNPALDIHEVRLHVDPKLAEQPEHASDRIDEDRELLLERMGRRVRGLERRLKQAIIGQGAAIDAMVAAVRKAAAGLGTEDRPLASFLFMGRTGTGKTELARVLARELFASDSHSGLLRIDCSEFGLAHEYSKLIGSPPGYVGHDDGGQLTDALAKHPESVVLFDEIEKAHPRMHNLLLQILEEGALTDGRGRRVDFQRAIVVMTSNAGADEMMSASRSLGFERARELGRTRLESITREALERQFSPEFLGRIDETILFDELDPKTVEKIARKKLFELALRARSRGLVVAFTPAVARWVAEQGYSTDYGARELRRVIQRAIEPELSAILLDGDRPHGGLVRVRIQGGRPIFAREA